MTETMREIFEYAVMGLLVLLIVLAIATLVLNIGFSKYLRSRKYRITTKSEYEPTSGLETFTIHIFNNNLTDTRLAAFGYTYKHRTIDYYKTYLKQIETSAQGKVVIPSRDAIKVRVDIDSLLSVIRDYNDGTVKVKPLKCFVTDTLGMTTHTNAKPIRKVIKKKLVELRDEARKARKAQLSAQREERREQRKKAAEMRKNQWKVRKERCIMWVKERWSRLRKRKKK